MVVRSQLELGVQSEYTIENNADLRKFEKLEDCSLVSSVCSSGALSDDAFTSFSSNCPSNEKHSTELKDSSLIWNNWRFFLNNKFILHNYPTTFPPGPRLHPARLTYQETQTASLATGEAFSWVHSTAHPLIAGIFWCWEVKRKKNIPRENIF